MNEQIATTKSICSIFVHGFEQFSTQFICVI